MPRSQRMNFTSWFPATQKAVPAADHIANDADGIENMGSTIDQIAQEDRAPSRGVPPAFVAPRGVRIRQSEPLPPCLFEQRPQFIGTAMQVAEDIERTRLVLLVVPQWHALDLNLLRSIEDVDVSKPLTLQSSEAAFHVADLPADHVRPEVPVRSAAVAFLASRSGVFTTMATAKQWYLRACSTRRFRSSARTLVASTTVSLPRASRFSIM